jgi:ABC-type branched-subunit amino acid transport system substrate-binding protein
MADAVAVHMRANGVRTMGFIGFADAYGDSWLAEMKRSAQTAGIRIVAEEKYNRNDPSVTGQVLKILAAQPDAVLIAGAGTPAATPHKEFVSRAYKGKIYQTHGVANADFLRVVGADGNGAVLPAGPMLVYEQLPDSNPVKKSAAEYVNTYEAKYGAGSRTTFGGHAWDAYALLQRAIPEALKRASRAARHSQRTAGRAGKFEGRFREQRRDNIMPVTTAWTIIPRVIVASKTLWVLVKWRCRPVYGTFACPRVGGNVIPAKAGIQCLWTHCQEPGSAGIAASRQTPHAE